MRQLHPGWTFATALAVGSAGLASGAGKQEDPKPTPEQTAFFENKIRPVLVNSCQGCHGKDAQMGGLRVDSRAALLKGGETGPSVVPGNPDKSQLILALRQSGTLKMPKGGRLTADQVAEFEAWVKMGAPWPATEAKKADTLWSLQPVRMPAVPKVKNKWWVQNPIDNFVLAKLESLKQKPVPTADRRTLLRRLTYDLTGLPPTPDEVDAFVADKSPNAYDKQVDRLLASPHYGERQARHWMDVARYADTKGYVFNEDRTYYNAYAYRDWLINAFNQDLPYDKFIIEQLAADRMPEVANGDDKTPLAALGFLTLGRRFLNDQPAIIDDRIDVTMRGFEGFTVECARCHDHKFDPIPTQDYYSLYAVFASSQEATLPISPKAIRDPWTAYNDRVTAAEGAVHKLVKAQVSRLRELVKNPAEAPKLSAEVKTSLMALRVEDYPASPELAKLAKAFEPAEQDRLSRLQQEIADLQKNAPQTPELAMAMLDGPHPSDGVVFHRGNPAQRGEVAPRRFLVALSKPGTEREHWDKDSGRYELAQAIASKDNPLTARVFVNRVWQALFGQGIVRTPSDFGHRGDLPTHPELLDYLAQTFMDNGWSIKKLQRMIVTSATYCQASSVPQAVIDADPENRNLGRMSRRRLELEEMRDTLFADAGRLDVSRVGGKSVDLWAAPYTTRRAVYGFIERQNLPGIFRTFDFASPDSTSARRFLTTVPQQALFFMNSPLVVQQAEAVAARPDVAGAKDDAQRIRRMYRDLFGRLPDASELADGLGYLKEGAVAAPSSDWQYGYGEFEASTARVKGYTPLGVFDEKGYHVAKAFPDPSLGYIVVNAAGGHPGHDRAHEVIRRWVAPGPMTVQISGVVAHGQKEGDGICARVVSSRSGLLGEWRVHNSNAKTEVASTTVQKGDTIDFVVDPQANDGYDAFSWAPTIRSVDGKATWNATAGFAPPQPPAPSRLVLYAQALMMTNEFMFVD
jgi:mono/diheme cytochrome c family protein